MGKHVLSGELGGRVSSHLLLIIVKASSVALHI